MLVKIRRNDFEVLNDVSLIWACIEPTIQLIRGKNFIVKSEVYAHLTTGQQALLMFQVLYGHTTKGIEEFYSHLSYLLSNKGVWSQLKNGMQYFGDYEMLHILEKMDGIFQSLKTEKFIEAVEQHNVLIAKNPELSASMIILNQSLSDVFPSSIKRVATYIRKNPDEFVQIID